MSTANASMSVQKDTTYRIKIREQVIEINDKDARWLRDTLSSMTQGGKNDSSKP